MIQISPRQKHEKQNRVLFLLEREVSNQSIHHELGILGTNDLLKFLVELVEFSFKNS